MVDQVPLYKLKEAPAYLFIAVTADTADAKARYCRTHDQCRRMTSDNLSISCHISILVYYRHALRSNSQRMHAAIMFHEFPTKDGTAQDPAWKAKEHADEARYAREKAIVFSRTVHYQAVAD